MSKIILDFGSGNTHKNNWGYLKRMLDELKAIDTGKHEIIIKHQLFEKAGDNIPLDRLIFDAAYDYAKELGYKTTSSVFDKNSLDFLLQFDPCFVKIANRRDLDWLIEQVPRRHKVYVSFGSEKEINEQFAFLGIVPMLCVSEYPTTVEKYEEAFGKDRLWRWRKDVAISDHTTDFGLWYRYQPKIIEMHYKLPDSTGLDAGPFARTPAQLAEIL
ncbi:MAG: N-acetylneuraminate synthase family protein [Smithella sp.]|jgi:sialic acid synthase SpsE